MKEKTVFKHVALHSNNREKSDLFFRKILALDLFKTFDLSKELSKQIFNIDEEVKVDVYSNEDSYFEIFITKHYKKADTFEHVCVEINDLNDFLKRCKDYNINPIVVKRGDKKLIFVKDFSNNLYEIKYKG